MGRSLVPPTAQRLLRDAPLRSAAGDKFAHGDYARALAEVLREAPSQATVGLFGAWGIGKSSILDGLHRELGDNATYAYYDAWRYEGDALRRQFLRDVGGAVKGFDVDAAMRDLRTDTQKTEYKLRWSNTYALRAALTAVLAGVIVVAFLTIADLTELVTSGDAKKVSLGAMVTVAVALVTTIVQVLQPVPQSTTIRRTEDPERFTVLFKQLLEKVKSGRLVIAIDNLDRCNPDHAVELLATIKTYLEPAVDELTGEAATPVAFVIAVDDEALRRHLLAKEVEQSAEGLVDMRLASRNVEEYLRKFFTVTLRIPAPLPRDIRDYVESQLEPIVTRRGIDADTAHRLAGLLGGPLRSNPRRVKQFINNLELRLTLIQVRERPLNGDVPPIKPPISDQPLVIAKLAVIEEEWPHHFARLVKEPQRLQEWESAAREPDPSPADPTTRGDPLLQAEWLDFAPFLIESADISIANVRPFLRYKRSAEEKKLEDYWEFRAAATAGNRDAVAATLSAHPDKRELYVGELPEIFDDELASNWFYGARAVAYCALLVLDPAVKEDAAALALIVKAGIDSAAFRREHLSLLPAEGLTDVVANETKHRKEQTATALVSAMLDTRPEVDRTALAGALGTHWDWVPEQDAARLQEGLESTHPYNAAIFRPLAEAETAFLKPPVKDDFAVQLEDQVTLLSTPQVQDLVGVLRLALASDKDPVLHDRVVRILGRGMAPNMAPQQAGLALSNIELLGRAADAATADARNDAIQQLATAGLPSGHSKAYLDAVLPLAAGADQSGPSSIVTQALKDDADTVLNWIDHRWKDADPAFRESIVESLGLWLATQPQRLAEVEARLRDVLGPDEIDVALTRAAAPAAGQE